MASDVFWTGLFTFGGGLVGALGTYWGSRSQHKLRIRELDLEVARQEREETHQAAQEKSEACEHRRRLYLRYLAGLDRLVHATSVGDLDRDGVAKRWAEFIAADDEVELGGTEAVKDASYPLHECVVKIVDAYTTVMEDARQQWPQDALSRWDAFEDEYARTRGDIVRAMRRDLLDEPEPG
jgi:hypothetical protein